MTLRLRHVTQFLRVVEQGSIGKAARSLGISQPALTKSLHQLESDLGVALLERSHNGARPTAFGDCLYKHAQRIEIELLQAEQAIEGLRSADRGVVNVGAIPAVARGFLPGVILQMTRLRPDVTVSVSEMNNTQLLAAFGKGEFDFIIAILDQGGLDVAHAVTPLFHDELVAVVRARHPLTEPADVKPEDLLSFPWIYPRAGSARRKRIDDFFRASGLKPPIATVEGSSTSFKLAILLKSDLIALLPHGVAASDENAKQLTAIRLNGPMLRRRIGVVHRGAANLSPATSAVIAEIEASSKMSDAPDRNVVNSA